MYYLSCSVHLVPEIPDRSANVPDRSANVPDRSDNVPDKESATGISECVNGP